MILFDEARIERLVASAGLHFWSGIGLIALAISLPEGWKAGGLTGFMLINLAVYERSFQSWRHEPGLWMLAAFLAVMHGALWAAVEFESVHGIWAGTFDRAPAPDVPWPSLVRSLDATMSMVLYVKAVRLAASVAVANRRVFRTRVETISWENIP